MADNSLDNRLGEETSPYLLQHADNPVAWQPWDEAAFAAARALDRPVLLSVGYAACHWCHVMAHESFENEAIAALMNRLFVNIKVDREERPDVDSLYQTTVALMGEQGGWPLTVFLTPEGRPFWGSTYFPPEPRYGRPGFPQVLTAISQAYEKDRARVAESAGEISRALGEFCRNHPGDAPTAAAVSGHVAGLMSRFDRREGGFGQAPKFPQPTNLGLLWRAALAEGRADYRDAVLFTLRKMCQGGIYDHLGGGFARYSVDHRWLVPHFEKMLYDNAQLIELLAWAWQESGDPLFAARAAETIAWAQAEMIADADDSGRASAGAFASSLDADSEGEEGRYYVWQVREIETILGGEAAEFMAAYDVSPGGNWEGKSILNRSLSPELGPPEAEARLADLRARVKASRDARVPPGRDDKVLADWNALMVAALTEAALVFERPDWLEAAEAAFAFLATEMSEGERLRHSWRRGRLGPPAVLDDYAFGARAALALYEARGEGAYLERAEAWMAVLDRHYWDSGGGGYFLSADDTGDLLLRTKVVLDNALPSGNGVAAGVLARLYLLTGKAAYRERAEALLGAFGGELARYGPNLASLIEGWELLARATLIVVLGDRGESETRALLRAVYDRPVANRVVQVVASDAELPEGHPAHGKARKAGQATAYLCRGMVCSLPMTDPRELAQALTPRFGG